MRSSTSKRVGPQQRGSSRRGPDGTRRSGRRATRTGASRSGPGAGGPRRNPVDVGQAQHEQGAVSEEDQLAAAAQEPGRLGDPPVGIGPDRGTVLGDARSKVPRPRVPVRRRPGPEGSADGDGPDTGGRWPAGPAWDRRPPGRAPRRASQAETYAVPQPSSITSRPANPSGKSPTEDSGVWKMPHDGSPADHCRSASSIWSARRPSHHSALARTYCGVRSVIDPP